MFVPAKAPLRAAPIDWTSDDPHLSGNFASIGPEIEAADLPVIAGRIPTDLSGAYMRNGPNPEFKPIAYNYPMDGDGMIHAVYFDNGRARYKNRFVRTRGLEVERRAGRAVYGSLFHLVPVDPKLVGPDGDPGPVKNGAFINVLRHGGHLLALGEAQPVYEMTSELDTLGEWTAGTGAPIEIGAHNRRHPTSGDLFAICYDALAPKVRVHRFDGLGRLAASFVVDLAAPSMIHDFVLTENYLVFVIGPAVFDPEAPMRREPFLQWRPELGTRIGVVALDGSSATWIEAPPFFVFHFANGFERGTEIVIDYVEHASFGPGYGAKSAPPALKRLVIDRAVGKAKIEAIGDFVCEFPRINDRFEARANRFVYAPTLTSTLKIARPPSATFNAIVKVDADAGGRKLRDLGDRIAGEPVFIPKPGASAEDGGYLAVYLYDPGAGTSDLALLDAADFDADPVAIIRMPQRVPQGLHGAWIPKL
jgi:carotenoid cleavage dioxygenase